MDEASFNLTDVLLRRDEDADTHRAATSREGTDVYTPRRVLSEGATVLTL